jgi:acetoin utilization deacetylase AcuC-like enzyme
VLVVHDEMYGDHLRDVGHPESPDRTQVVASRLLARGVVRDMIPARDASDQELTRVHAPGYLELVKRECANPAHYLSTGDTVIDEKSFAVARRAAGGAIVATEIAVARNKPVFALIRPPGHHAEPARGMGFCIFNNAAIAARAFLAEHGGRVLVVDFDYHHGNGTQMVAGTGLSYVSTHAFPAYPGTGSKHENYALPERDLIVNVPLPPSGVSTEAFVALWQRLLALTAARVRPNLILVSAGFDYVKGDAIGDLGIEVAAAGALAAAILATASTYCDNRIAYVLEGGYQIDAIEESIVQIAGAGATVRSADVASISSPQQDTLRKIQELLRHN